MENKRNSGISSLVMICRMQQIPAGYEEIQAWLGKNEEMTTEDLLLVSEEFLKIDSKKSSFNLKDPSKQPFPVIGRLVSGEFCIILKVEGENILYYDVDKQKSFYAPLKKFSDTFEDEIILIKKRRDSNKGIEDFSINWFTKTFLKEKKIMGQVLTSAFLIQLFALVTPLFTMIIIDKVFSSSGKATLEVLIIGLALIAVFDFSLGYARKHLLNLTTAKIDVIMVSRLFRHLTSLPLSFFSNRQSGDTIARFKEVEFIRNFLSSSILATLIDAPFGIIFLIVMYLFSPLLTGVVVLSIILLFIIYGVVSPFLKEKLKEKQEITTESQSFLFETVSSIETIKSMSIEPGMQRKWEEHLGHQTIQTMETENLTGNIGQISGFLNKGTVALCLWIGALSVLEGNMTAGQLIAFNMLVGRVMGPAQRVAQMLQQIYQVKISVKRVSEIFNTQQEPALYEDTSGYGEMKGKVSFNGVFFQYTSDLPFVLEDINFEAKAGEVIGIVGHTGSGKTTLTRLIQRLHIPTKGKLFIDGIDTAGIDPVWLRRKIGVVMQDNLLLNKSVKENLMLANPFATMEQIESAAKLAGADEFIRSLPKSYDTVVGERGEMISTGQRQRIAFARALVNEPKILILDEATSSLDFESETLIHNNLKKICQGRTVFIVSHRFSTLKIADRVICLQKGNIIEQGSIQNLIKDKGYFFRLYENQTSIDLKSVT
ncbi:MAG: peptidase domain-containing ABC transporter [Campylobacterales bacterium]|nr:peptidase domain-containing ABC transporter [Campylobacterales bacterium]